MEAALRAAFICCDAMYCEVIANPQQAVPLERASSVQRNWRMCFRNIKLQGICTKR